MAKYKSPNPNFDLKTYAYTDCREQHKWNHYEGHIDKKNKIAVQVQNCGQCDMKRKRIMSMHEMTWGKTLSRTYLAPVDYYVKGGLTSLELGQIRMANFLADLGQQ